MDIRNWPLGRIMQLPDHCFGRRWAVSVAQANEASQTNYDISEVALPDVGVMWEVGIYGFGAIGQLCTIRLAIGDQLPAAAAEMDRLEPLIMGLGFQGADPRRIRLQWATPMVAVDLRMPIQAQGRRLVMEVVTDAGQVMDVICVIVVSGVPTEVPNCLLSV